jgi:hypothetical protein
MTEAQEEQLCVLLEDAQQQLLAEIDKALLACSTTFDQADRAAGLHSAHEPVIDPQYLYAALHQHCFAQLHQGEAEVARFVADNQSALAEQL